MLDTNYSHHIDSLSQAIDLRKHLYQAQIYLYRVWNIITGSEIICLS